MTQIKKKKKEKRQTISGKKDYSVRHFTLVLTTAKEIPKAKGKILTRWVS